SGTNILIYAYGLVDPDESEINYHETRRGTRMVPLQSYNQPPSDDKFAGLDYFELRLNNYIVPSNDTTYYCKIYKAPTSYTTKRHAIAVCISLWTKLIRNKTAVEYLFNAESYHFNYQFENRLAKPIQLYPGDEFATRCIYNTMNKNEITLGGEKTREEMCLHFFTYYPRMDDLSVCYTMNTVQSLQDMINSSAPFDYFAAKKWFLDLKWTPESAKQWQEYYNKASRVAVFAGAGQFEAEPLDTLPEYQDFKPVQCQKQIITNNNAAFIYQKTYSFLSVFIILAFVV
ncbi:unnamed protein product, partial [Rotaria sordida]